MIEHASFLGFRDHAVAIVTGAGAGIGRATAELLLSEGVTVAGWDVAAKPIQVFQREVEQAGARALGLCVDVTDPDRVRSALTETAERLGSAQYLVNNAGPPSSAPLSFADGVRAALGSVELVTSAWLETSGAHGGSVVNVASVIGQFVGIAAADWYPAAKAGIAGYTRQLALNRPREIRANAVAPGLTATDRTRQWISSPRGAGVIERNPMRRAGTPADVARAIAFLLSPAAAYINGVVLPVDGGSLVVQ